MTFHVCSKRHGCTGVSIEGCTRQGAMCRVCNQAIGKGVLCLYAHSQRNTQAGQSGWYHLTCAAKIPTEVSKRKSKCRLTDQDIQSGTTVVRLAVGGSGKINILHIALQALLALTTEQLAQLGAQSFNQVGAALAVQKIDAKTALLPYVLDNRPRIRKAAQTQTASLKDKT